MSTWTTIDDVTKEEWVALDFELEKYDRTDKPYDLIGHKLLAFIFRQIYRDDMNFYKVPSYIRNGTQFQKLAVLYNNRLMLKLFPDQSYDESITKSAKFMELITGCARLECEELLKRFGNFIDAVNYLRKNSNEPQYDGLTDARYDVLDKKGNVIFTCETIEGCKNSGYSPLFYRIRVVDRVGRYSCLNRAEE